MKDEICCTCLSIHLDVTAASAGWGAGRTLKLEENTNHPILLLGQVGCLPVNSTDPSPEVLSCQNEQINEWAHQLS